MIRVIASIKLYGSGASRSTPFTSGYRPLFNFIDEMKTSGQITLTDRKEFFPGDEGEVEIAFVTEKFLGESFGIGTRFTFGEGHIPLGEGVINEII
jgi:translation elongation factor EF-Tu-like GTPase